MEILMTIPTKRRRLSIYKKALAIYEVEREYGICHCIDKVRNFGEPNPYMEDQMSEGYPELWAYKPEHIRHHYDYWFETAQERIDTMKKIIAEIQIKK